MLCLRGGIVCCNGNIWLTKGADIASIYDWLLGKKRMVISHLWLFNAINVL